MGSLDDIKETLRARLITSDGNIDPQSLLDIIEDAKKIPLKEAQIAGLMQEVDRSINWERIRQQKAAAAAQQQAFEQARQKRQEEIDAAPVLLETMLSASMDDGVVTADELNVLFEWAGSLEQNITKLEVQIKKQLDAACFKPYPSPNAKLCSIREILASTDWYSPEKFPAPSLKQKIPPSPPQPQLPTGVKKGGGISIRIFFGMLVALVIVILIWQAASKGDSTVAYHPVDSSMTTTTAALSPTITSSTMALGSDTLKMKTETKIETRLAYNGTPISELAGGGGNSGLSEQEANNVYRAVTGYYEAGNASSKEHSGIEKYFRFPIRYYYRTPTVGEVQLIKNMHFQDSFFVFTRAELLPASVFRRKEGGKYFLHTKETFSYRTIRDRDSLITKSVEENLVLNEDYTIDSVYQTYNQVTSAIKDND